MAGNNRFNATCGKVSLTTLARTGLVWLNNNTSKTIKIINVEVTTDGGNAEVIFVADSTTGAGTIGGAGGTAIDPASLCLVGQTDTIIDAKKGADAVTCPAGTDIYHDFNNIEDMSISIPPGHSFAVAVVPDAALDVYCNVHYDYV